MKYLLDTHTFLWAVSSPESLGDTARELFENPDSSLYFSVATSWGISIKVGIGKLSIPEYIEQFIQKNISRHNLEVLNISLDDTLEMGRLPLHHKDPFDRILISQSRNQKIPIITKDPQIGRYDVEIIW